MKKAQSRGRLYSVSSDLKKILKNHTAMVSARSNWLNQWQIVGEYISQIKQDFETQHSVGEFLNEDIFDSTGTFAAKNSASAILGILWPSSARKSVKIDAPEDMGDLSEDETHWYEEIATKRLQAAMDTPKAGLALSLDEYMGDQILFGTSGVGTFWEDDGLFYKSFGVKEMIIDEGKGGDVNIVHIQYSWTIKRVVETYGFENVSPSLQEKFENDKGLEDKIDIIVAYRPREEILRGEEHNLDMPFSSTHFEKATMHTLKEGGFEEFPIQVTRFRKLLYEKYGRSMAMDALPDIREINALKEAVIVATEKMLDPPLGLINSGVLGGGLVDTSAGALTVFDAPGNLSNTPPVFPINTVGDLNAALARIQSLEQSIGQHFSIDRLLDFNNETAMTATETVQRANIRNASLTSLIARQVAELFRPLVERSFNLMLRNDKFGYIDGTAEAQAAAIFGEEIDIIPDRIAQRLLAGEDAYTVRFTTPADRITNAEELDGMIQVIQMNQQLMQTHPEAGAYLDIGRIHSNGTRLFGSPPDIIRSDEEVEEIQLQQAQQAQQQQQLNQAEQVAGIAGAVNQSQ